MATRNTIELFYGTGAAERFEALRAELFAQPIRPGEQSWLIVVPTHRRARALREAFYLAQKVAATCEPLIFGVHELIARLARRVPEQRRILSRAEQEMLIDALLRRLAPQLSHIRRASNGQPFPGLVRHLAQLFSALAELQQTPAALERLPGGTDASDSPALRDLATLLAAYESLLSHEGLADAALWQNLVVAAVTPERLQNTFPHLQRAIFDGFDIYTPSLQSLIETCAKALQHVDLFMPFDGDAKARAEPFARDPREIFPHLVEAFEHLSRFVGRRTRVEQATAGRGAVRDAIARHLFACRRPLEEKIPAARFIRIIAARDRRDEVQRIARWIKQHALEANSPQERAERVRRVGVTFAQLEHYAPLVRELFADYGIPYQLSTGISLAHSPVVRAILEVLNLVRTKYHRTALLRVLTSPYCRVAGAGEESLSAEVLSALSIRLFIVDGKEKWSERLERELRRVDLRCHALSQGYEEQEEETSLEGDLEALRAQRAQVEASLKGLRALFATLEPLESPGTLGDFRERLLTILDAIGFSSLAMSRETGLVRLNTIRFEIESERLFVKALNDLVALEPQIARGTVDLDEFERLLRWAVEGVTLHPRDEEASGVQVMGKLEPRGMRFDYLIVGGLVEGEFPAQPAHAAFFTPQQLAALGLRHPRLALSEERFLFSLYLAETAHGVILTYPQVEGEEVLLRSSFVDEIEQIAAVGHQSADGNERIYSAREVQRALGRALAASPACVETSPEAELLRSFASTLAPELARKVLHEASRRVNVVLVREKTAALSEYDGMIADAALKDDIARRVDERIFSVSQLEEYGRCPFIFFCRRLLGIEPLEKLEEELTPLERGSLLHEILYRFYTVRRARGAAIFRTPEELETARAQLLEIAQERLARYAFGGILWEVEKERFLGAAGRLGRKGILQRFLELEQEEFSGKAAHFEPRFFEASFGRVPEIAPTRDPLSGEEPFVIRRDGVEVRLRGKIDRIDILGDAFLVVDYKSGKTVPDLNDLDDGLGLQLPLYLLAARWLLRRRFEREFEIAAALYFVLHDDANCDRKLFLFDEHYRSSVVPRGKRPRTAQCPTREAVAGHLERAGDIAVAYVNAMKAGHFHPTLREAFPLCSSCDYRYVCRVNYAKMQHLKSELPIW